MSTTTMMTTVIMMMTMTTCLGRCALPHAAMKQLAYEDYAHGDMHAAAEVDHVKGSSMQLRSTHRSECMTGRTIKKQSDFIFAP